MNYNNDYFQSNFNITGCNFVPWGPSLNACKTYCLNSDTRLKNLYNTNNKCNEKKCLEICNKCENINRCQWLSTIKEIPPKPYLEELGLTINLTYKLETNDNSSSNKINLKWNKELMVNNYMIHYKKSIPSIDNNQTKILYTNDNYFSFVVVDQTNNSANNTTVDSYILDTNSDYNFKIYGLNSFGITSTSNILSIKT